MNEQDREIYIYKIASATVMPQWGGDFYKFELLPEDYERYEQENWVCPKCGSTGSFAYWWSGDRFMGDPHTKVLFYLRYIPFYRCSNCSNEEPSMSALMDVDDQADVILESMGIPKE